MNKKNKIQKEFEEKVKDEKNENVRAYTLQHFANEEKCQQAFYVMKEYRIVAPKMANQQWRIFYENGNGKFNRQSDIKNISTTLSERYKRNVCYQVVGMLDSFISNRQEDFIRKVFRSTIDKETRKQLFKINIRKLWFVKEHPKFSSEHLFLAKKIFKMVSSKHNKPSYDNINMMLNANVAEIILNDKKESPEFDYWIKLSTLTKGDPIFIPLKTNKFFNDKKGKLKNSVQINKTEDGKMKVVLMKEAEVKEIKFLTDKISIDRGLVSAFTIDNDMLGRRIYPFLKQYDVIISDIARNSQLQGLPIKCERYDTAVKRIKNFLKNELCRLLNIAVKRYSPKTIVMEHLDFRNQNLSERLNRIIGNFGQGVVNKKLESISEEYGIKIEKVHAAYSSQQCHVCSYVEKKNRKTQANFECKHCGKKCNADVNASRVLLLRSSDQEMKNIYLGRDKILVSLVRQFKEKNSRHYSLAKLPFRDNPYFWDRTDKGTPIDPVKDRKVKQKEFV